MQTAVIVLTIASAALPIGALAWFLLSARAARTEIERDVLAAKDHHRRWSAALTEGNQAPAEIEAAALTAIRTKYGIAPLTRADMNVVDLVEIARAARRSIPSAWAQFIVFSIGLLCGAAATLIQLGN